MTDLEISKALARAIGWRETEINNVTGLMQCWVFTGTNWREFDYRDWNVAGPIAEKLIVELIKCESRKVVYWEAIHGMEDDDNHAVATANTPQKAIALAVIQGAKK